MIKSIAFPFLKRLLWFKRRINGYAILTYHNISDTSDLILPDPMTVNYASFKQQIDYISNEFSVISISEIVERVTSKTKADKLYVGITFDDGILNQYKLAVPFLESLNLPATFFITTNYADQTEISFLDKLKYWVQISNTKVKLEYNDKNHGLYDLSNRDEKSRFYKKILLLSSKDFYVEEKLVEYLNSIFINVEIPRFHMTWEEIKDLSKSPNFTIGGHSVTHKVLTDVENVLEDEIINSKKIIEQKLNIVCNYFAYPFGTKSEVSNYLFSLMESSGYEASFTSFSGLNNDNNSIHQLSRIAPLAGDSIEKLLVRLFWADEINIYRAAISR